jgi:hypothetical protein
MPSILTVDSQVMCPHGGQAILTTANSLLTVDDSLALLESDVHEVADCPFVAGVEYSPCVLIEWSSGAQTLTVNDTGVLTELSVGLCSNAEGAPQGVAVIVDGDPDVDAV